MKGILAKIEDIKGQRICTSDLPPDVLYDKYCMDEPYKHYCLHVGHIDGAVIDRVFWRRCDASRFAKRHGAKELQHWYF